MSILSSPCFTSMRKGPGIFGPNPFFLQLIGTLTPHKIYCSRNTAGQARRVMAQGYFATTVAFGILICCSFSCRYGRRIGAPLTSYCEPLIHRPPHSTCSSGAARGATIMVLDVREVSIYNSRFYFSPPQFHAIHSRSLTKASATHFPSGMRTANVRVRSQRYT